MCTDVYGCEEECLNVGMFCVVCPFKSIYAKGKSKKNKPFEVFFKNYHTYMKNPPIRKT